MIRRLRNRYVEVRMLQISSGCWFWADIVFIVTGRAI